MEILLSSKIRFFRSFVWKLSQEELAAELGISQAQISRYERGTAVPNSEQLERLSEVLQVPLGERDGHRG